MNRSTTIRLTIAIALLIAVATLLRYAGGSFMATLRRMHGHP